MVVCSTFGEYKRYCISIAHMKKGLVMLLFLEYLSFVFCVLCFAFVASENQKETCKGLPLGRTNERSKGSAGPYLRFWPCRGDSLLWLELNKLFKSCILSECTKRESIFRNHPTNSERHSQDVIPSSHWEPFFKSCNFLVSIEIFFFFNHNIS